MKKKNKIKIKLNGKDLIIPEKTTIKTLIDDLKLPINKIAIEKNRKILDKKKINKIILNKKDRIEIVHFIGGG
tara:strand:+ start:197 stop:415 length:219 start_codon:yes stop_codon:yes gene_type:complete